MTSNIGARMITDRKALGFSSKEQGKEESDKKEYEAIKKDVMAELKKEFRPEFINRIDEIIVFHKLHQEEIHQIMDLMLQEVEKRLQEQNIHVQIDSSVKKVVEEKGIDETYGARPLRRAIQNVVEDTIAEAILDGKIKPGEEKKLVAKDGTIVVE